MRYIAYTIALAAALAAAPGIEAETVFAPAEWLADLGLSIPLPKGAVADPFDLPNAEAYLVSDGGAFALEDRFDTFDLWTAMACRGRWRFGSGRAFSIARLDFEMPRDAAGTVRTRSDFRRRLLPLDAKDDAGRDETVYALVPFGLDGPERVRRNGRRNLIEVLRYPSTNDTLHVYAFRPRSPEAREKPPWYLAVFQSGADDDPEEFRSAIEDVFLDGIGLPAARSRKMPPPLLPDGAAEADLLAEDYRRSVANYSNWHFAVAGDIMIADNLDAAARGPFIASLTNGLPRMRREYAAAMPSKTGEAFHPAAIRVFATREEYLAYVGVEAKWTAALWSPAHRELVLYLPEDGTASLLRTVWHEAFHQYLAYAGAMIQTAPWINEGHAELFENSHFGEEGELAFDAPPECARFIHENAEALAEVLPALFGMDYADFYGGSQEEREMKYRLAWSVAYFLQTGAPDVRFRPFEKLRGDYADSLVRTRDGLRASRAVLSGGMQEKLVDEWLAFWRRRTM